MAEVIVDRLLTETEWDALRDPDGGRYEIIDGRLVMSPSANADHNDLNLDLVMIVREAIRAAALDLRVTTDVEWRTVADDVVLQAPRGDLVVGTVDAVRRIHDALPLLVGEVWSAVTRPGVIESRRNYWRSLGLAHYWEIALGDAADDTTVSIWDLDKDRAPTQATGHQRLSITQPFAMEIVPADLHGWADARAQRLEHDAAAQEQHAAAHERRADEHAQRAQAAEERVRELADENARLAQRLHDLEHPD